MEIYPRVTQISTWFLGEVRTELYLIRGKRNAIIDTGTPQSPQNDIAPALKDLGLTLADIDLILCTHGHSDHVGGNAAIKSVSNAQILIHTDDAIFLEDHEGSFEQYVAPAMKAILGKENLEEEKAHFLEMAGPEVAVDRQLKDNDIIDLGDECELRVIHLPGHSSGSVGFYWEKEGILFSGDSLPGLNHESGGLPITPDLAAYEGSLERLRELPLQLILHAHYWRGLTLPPSPITRREEVRQYLRDCQEVAKRMGEAVRRIAPYAPGKPFMEVYDQVVAQLPKEMGFKPASQIPQPLFNAVAIFSSINEVEKI